MMKQSKYDFLLFENWHQAKHHKYDLFLIARLLQSKGLKVAVLDVYHEDKEDEKQGVPVIHLHFNHAIPNDKWNLFPKNKLINLLCLLRFLWQQHFYMKQVLAEVEPLADRFYCGSYNITMSSTFMHSQKKCYYWGLRSAWMSNFWSYFKKNPVHAIRMAQLRRAFKSNESQCLFVSNEIIRREFEQLGVPRERMVIREERCIEALGRPMYEQMNEHFSLLTIGTLRKDKRVDYTVREFLQAQADGWTFVLAGRTRGNYERVIEEATEGHAGIVRINEFMDYDKFYKIIHESHFVVLADIQQKSCVTNGTMMEALINYRPIIAPNYEPYKSYIEKYGIGIMFDPDNPGDLARAMKEAEQRGCRSFYDNIERFLHTIEFPRVADDLYEQLYNEH